MGIFSIKNSFQVYLKRLKKLALYRNYTAILGIIFNITFLHHHFRDFLSLNNKSWHPASYKDSILYDYDDQADKKAIAFLFFTKNN
ncbi:hypothetical protein BAY32_17470 [Elizabethkingia ursingii]|uniref:Uncharacterized protein n=1 Tax=Elizabethkingia ursingii TaxID=1756150 RepID=A0AAJ3NF21_9FLAO|nr:hypothetical protein BBD34_02965 [Elizabethkingia ursingii]OPB79487.1 hypothetical protein BAY32_17470 [Elizabethkingia ursingii]